MIAALAGLARAQEQLVFALDSGRVEPIETATRALGEALAQVKRQGGLETTPEARDAVAGALGLVDAAAIRTNFLAEQARRRLDALMRARGAPPRIGYTRAAQHSA
ncbi:hypothetical protein [Sphingomonas jatrophae]|uniref:Uncharacterized protein n=1 Tax=Sphingomonas jatrophae TaxID=1166337 RepID=A0A1I6MAU5_9SPHN|nr:hypothetical protein [Sphingomonas jatrophae]SFS12846.1 hypothetical protein SAMN05192580_3816 [Sphingomonas jatrophae]